MQKEEQLADIWTVLLRVTDGWMNVLHSCEVSCDLYLRSVTKLVLSLVCINMSQFVLKQGGRRIEEGNRN